MIAVLFLLFFQDPAVVILPSPIQEHEHAVAASAERLAQLEAECARANLPARQEEASASEAQLNRHLSQAEAAREEWENALAQQLPESRLRALSVKLSRFEQEALALRSAHRKSQIALSVAAGYSDEERAALEEERDMVAGALTSLRSVLTEMRRQEVSDRVLDEAGRLLESAPPEGKLVPRRPRNLTAPSSTPVTNRPAARRRAPHTPAPPASGVADAARQPR